MGDENDLKYILSLNEAIESMDETKLLIMILNLPDYLDHHPYPGIVNTTINRISEAFISSTCPLKIQISRTIAKCQSHLHMINNFGELVSRLSNVLYSNDPIERSAVLIIFSSLAVLAKNRGVNNESNNTDFVINCLYHQLIVSLQSRDQEEMDTAIIVTYKFVKYSPDFARLLLKKLDEILQKHQEGVFSRLIRAYSYMNHDLEMTKTAFQSLVSLIEKHPESCFTSLTRLALKNPLIVEKFVKLCFEYLELVDGDVKVIILKNLTKIAQLNPALFSLERIQIIFKLFDQKICPHFFHFLYLLLSIRHNPAILFIRQHFDHLLKVLQSNVRFIVILFIVSDYLLDNDQTLLIKYSKVLNDGFEKVFLNFSSFKYASTQKCLCRSYTKYLIKLPRNLLAQLDISDFLIKSLCFTTKLNYESQLTKWLYIVHIHRFLEISNKNLLYLRNQITNMLKDNPESESYHKYIDLLIVYQHIREIGEFEWLKNILENIAVAEAYKIGIITTLYAVYPVSTIVFNRITKYPIFKVDFQRHIREIMSISKMETYTQKETSKAAVSVYSGIRSHFQKSYSSVRIDTLELGRSIYSMFFAMNNVETSGSFINPLLNKYTSYLNIIKADWQRLYKFMYDSDIKSKHLIQSYITIFDLLLYLLQNQDSNIGCVINELASYKHPFSLIIVKVLDILTNQNLSFSNFVSNFVFNTILISWPLPLYYYKSSFKMEIALNFKEAYKESGISATNYSKVGEFFNFAVEGFFKIAGQKEKRRKTEFTPIKNLEVVASINKVNEQEELVEQFTRIAVLENEYFSCDLAMMFEKVGTYKISVYVDSIVDKNGEYWEIQYFRCQDIQLMVYDDSISNDQFII